MRRLYTIKLDHLSKLILGMMEENQRENADHATEAALLDELEKELQEARLHHDQIHEGGE